MFPAGLFSFEISLSILQEYNPLAQHAWRVKI
jgi:hypothetical protein